MTDKFRYPEAKEGERPCGAEVEQPSINKTSCEKCLNYKGQIKDLVAEIDRLEDKLEDKIADDRFEYDTRE